MTDVFEFSEYERGKFIYEFTDMTQEQIVEKKAKLEAYNKEQEEKKAAAAKAKAEEAAKPKEEHRLRSRRKKISQKNNVSQRFLI
jgi:hypothetical protein